MADIEKCNKFQKTKLGPKGPNKNCSFCIHIQNCPDRRAIGDNGRTKYRNNLNRDTQIARGDNSEHSQNGATGLPYTRKPNS